MAKKRKRRNARRPDLIPPTPETKAKLEADPLRMMVEKGLIDSAGERAANEIAAVFYSVCRGVMRHAKPLGPYTPGIFEMADEIAEAHALRYLPWCRDNRPQTVSATIDLVVDRVAPKEGAVRDAVADALADYARRFERQWTPARKNY